EGDHEDGGGRERQRPRHQARFRDGRRRVVQARLDGSLAGDPQAADSRPYGALSRAAGQRRMGLGLDGMEPTPTLTASDEDSSSLTPVAAQYLVVALDCVRPLTPPVRLSLDTRQVIIGRSARREWARSRDGELHLSLPDSWISSAHARLVSDGSHWFLEDH